MKTGTMVAAVLAGSVALVCTVLVAHQNGAFPVQGSQAQPSADDARHLKIAPTGPYPKAVADETEFDFGTMLFMKRKSHTFVIRNEGEIPLKVRNGGTTCSCTVSKMADGAVPPGESVKIEVSWEPYGPAPHFKQSAIIWTNDPEHPELRFAVSGAVEKLATIVPSRVWDVGRITDEKSTIVTGQIYSRLLDEFKVLTISSSGPYVQAKAIKFGSKELAKFKAKSGWTIKATIPLGIPVGRLNEQLTIRTDIKDKASFSLAVRGYRPGPIRIVPTAGIKWDAESSTIGMGLFRHEEGRTVKLFVYLKGLNNKHIQVLGVECDLPFLDVQLDTKNVVSIGGEQRYLLTFHIPPGKSRMSRIGSDPVKVILKTSHPNLPVINLNVKFVSL